MITYLAKFVNILASIFQNVVIFTSYIGQVIVLLVTIVTSFIYNALKCILLFFQIVYEDNVTIFTEDLPTLTNNFYDAFYYHIYYLCNVLTTLGSEIIIKANLIIGNIKWSISILFFIIYEVLSYLKKTIIFFGDTLWLVLTFVPVHLPDLTKALFKYMKDSVVNSVIDAYMALLRVTNFLSDVPLESFMGILTAMIIARSCIHFRETIQVQIMNIYWILVRKVTYLYHVVYNYFTDSEVRMITQIVGGQAVVSRDIDFQLASDNEDPANAAEALCVICQERQKCVLTLPCRHVCLCTECCMRLYGYQRTCPICRTFIYHSVTVYL